ncbi:MAG: hypothetical protein IPJ85_03000 [Flavobacteriales bacterium]|nr:hypothetical protein [Flavobacteriales bacterium]
MQSLPESGLAGYLDRNSCSGEPSPSVYPANVHIAFHTATCAILSAPFNASFQVTLSVKDCELPIKHGRNLL